MPQDQEKKERKGIVKVFLSSTYRDLHETRERILDQLSHALESAAMETFISRGEGPQTTALEELKDSDIAIFLISPHYGTDIPHCTCTGSCEADCRMKNGAEQISYTWCEYRVALAQEKPHSTYLVDEGWTTTRSGAPNLWKFRDEVEKEYCPRIKNDDKGVEKVVSDLVNNILDWYSHGEIDFHHFCGRRDTLKDLFSKMRGSVNVYGVGGIGKTALCEVVLLLLRLQNKEVVYCGSEEAYASGTGYEYTSEHLNPPRYNMLTIDDITDVLGLDVKGAPEKMKIEIILQTLEKRGAILFVDNVKRDMGIKKLIKGGNALSKGCILASSKRDLRVASHRVSVEHIEEGERGSLVEIMASRLGKEVNRGEKERIEDIAEGHPIATYLLVSNVGRVPLDRLKGFKEGLDFSEDSDVKEYMKRVIKSGIAEKAYELLRDLAVIEGEISLEMLYEAFPGFPYSEETVLELFDSSIMERKGDMVVWKYNQIREAIFEEAPKRHKLAGEYHRKRLEKHGKTEDEIEMLYHFAKRSYAREILISFMKIENSLKEEDPLMRKLPRLGEEIKSHVVDKERAILCGTLGNIYGKISKYREKVENCKKAIKAYDEALKVYTFEDFPMGYATTQNNLGTAYRTLAEVENKAENCKKAIKACDEALKVRTFEDFPMDYAGTQNNLGNAYRTLAEVENKAENCKKAIKACDEALRIFTKEEFPEQHQAVKDNLRKLFDFCFEKERSPKSSAP